MRWWLVGCTSQFFAPVLMLMLTTSFGWTVGRDREAIASGLVTRDECADLEAFLFIGIPAITIFHGLVVSATCQCDPEFI